jgi:hypothetical protein
MMIALRTWLGILAFGTACRSAGGGTPQPPHVSSISATPSQRPSLPDSPTSDTSWLKIDAATKTATFQLIAGLTGLNGALNFYGYRDGGLTLTVPVGWNVVMEFSNKDGDLPHSAEVIDTMTPLPPGPVDAAFPRAVTIRLAQGLEAGQTDDIRFVADRAGSFVIFCAVPGHGLAGRWMRFVVSATAARPAVST